MTARINGDRGATRQKAGEETQGILGDSKTSPLTATATMQGRIIQCGAVPVSPVPLRTLHSFFVLLELHARELRPNIACLAETKILRAIRTLPPPSSIMVSSTWLTPENMVVRLLRLYLKGLTD